MQIFKIIMELYTAVFFFLRAKKWGNISKWERFAILLVFAGLIMILANQYRTGKASGEVAPHSHMIITYR